MARNQKGRGWFGDSEGHAKAGRKGGLATARKRKENRGSQEKESDSEN